MSAENIVIKMVNEHYGTDHDIQKLIYYIAGKGRNEGRICFSIKGRGYHIKRIKPQNK